MSNFIYKRTQLTSEFSELKLNLICLRRGGMKADRAGSGLARG
jgi:hypothetical protein